MAFLSFKVNFGSPLYPVAEAESVYYPTSVPSKQVDGKDLSTGYRDKVRIHKLRDRLSPHLIQGKHFDVVKILTMTNSIKHAETLYCYHCDILDTVYDPIQSGDRKGAVREIVTLRVREAALRYLG